jgi:hypothetical protein
VGLRRSQRRENCEERNDETTREQFAEGVRQVEPLVFDHEDGGPTTRNPATNAAAPFDVRFVSTSIGEGPDAEGRSRRRSARKGPDTILHEHETMERIRQSLRQRQRFGEPVPAEGLIVSQIRRVSGGLQAASGQRADAGSCEQSGECQSVAGIAVAEKNRCLRLTAPGAWSVADRH